MRNPPITELVTITIATTTYSKKTEEFPKWRIFYFGHHDVSFLKELLSATLFNLHCVKQFPGFQQARVFFFRFFFLSS